MGRVKASLIAGCVAVGSASMAHAAVTLPGGTLTVRVDGVAAFDTSLDPTISVQTGDLAVNVLDPTILTAMGQATSLVDSTDTNNSGNFDELSFMLSGAELVPLGLPSVLAVDGMGNILVPTTQNIADNAVGVTYIISSGISNGTLKMWDDSPGNLNTAVDLIGQPVGDHTTVESNPSFSNVVDGDLFLEAGIASATAVIIIEFSRPDTSVDFDSSRTLLQSFNSTGFDITGGSILDDHPEAAVSSITATQAGVFSVPNFTPVNGLSPSIDELISGSFSVEILLPEPGTLLLLGAGSGLLMTSFRRRKEVV